MNAEIKKKWVAALRSGKYRQGWRFLHFRDAFCCLGVLCDLAAKEGVCEVNNPNGITSYDGVCVILPDSVCGWAELPHTNPFGLAEMNDKGKSFSEIADYIEERV